MITRFVLGFWLGVCAEYFYMMKQADKHLKKPEVWWEDLEMKPVHTATDNNGA